MNKKELIIKNACILFSEKGYYGLGLAELLKSCDIPKGSFYYYFPQGKIQLACECLMYSYDSMKQYIIHLYQSKDNVFEVFDEMAVHLSQGVTKDTHKESMLMTMLSIESVYLSEEVHQVCKYIYDDWQQIYVDIFIHFGYQDNAAAMAQSVFALIHGSMISSWIKRNGEDLLLIRPVLQQLLK